MRTGNLSFGDNVRVRSTPLTSNLGLAGVTGTIYGSTKPSITAVSVIGGASNDFAFSVMLHARKEQLWFAPELLEFIDHAPGTEIRVGSQRLMRDASGEWHEGPSR